MSGAVQEGLMLNGFQSTSGIGVDERVVQMNMTWLNFPLTSRFYAKLVKYTDEIRPKLYLKKQIFNASLNPVWNTRKLVVFKWLFVQNSYVKELLGELVEDDVRERGYSCFNIVMIKPNEGAGNIFYPLREGLYGGQTVGLGDNQRMNLDRLSYVREIGNIKYTEYFNKLVWEFYFGYTELTDIWSPIESNNPVVPIRNPFYVSRWQLTTGNIPEEITEFKMCCLITPTDNVKIFCPIQQTYAFLKNDPLWIYKGDNSLHTYAIQTSRAEEVATIPLELGSDDLYYKTFNERIKTIAGRTYYIVNVKTGIDGYLYKLNLKIINFNIVNQFGNPLATIELGGTTDFFINIQPASGINDLEGSTLYFSIDNLNPHLLLVPKIVAYPATNNIGQLVAPEFECSSFGNEGDVDEFIMPIVITSMNPFFNNIIQQPIQVNVANLYINADFVLINIYDLTNLLYSQQIQILPRRYEDITQDLQIDATYEPSLADYITFKFKSTVSGNKFFIEETESLSITLKSYQYGQIWPGKQGDVFHIDTSDPSNFGHRLTFYDANDATATELKNTDGEPLAQYSRSQPQGTPDSYVTIRLPLTNTTIYYRTQPLNPRQNYTLYGYGQINLDPLVLEQIGNVVVGDVDGTTAGGELALVSNGVQGQYDVRLAAADNDLFGVQNIGVISVRTVAITPPINVRYDIANDNEVHINWDVEVDGNTIYSFADPTKTRYTTTASYEILREGINIETGDKEYNVIGTAPKCEWIDYNAVRFTNYKYQIRAIVNWNTVEVTSKHSDTLFIFVCENNKFPLGRWNNTTENRKLYQDIGASCESVGMLPSAGRLTGNLFPPAQQMTKSEIYSMMAQAQGRPSR